jgi:hypothetical protein
MIQISEDRLAQLIEAEKTLKGFLDRFPELANGNKLTPTAKRYRNALEKLVDKIEEVCDHDSFKGVFEVSYIHGFKYDGPTFTESLKEAKALLKRK